jgi:hypothetical protein
LFIVHVHYSLCSLACFPPHHDSWLAPHGSVNYRNERRKKNFETYQSVSENYRELSEFIGLAQKTHKGAKYSLKA